MGLFSRKSTHDSTPQSQASPVTLPPPALYSSDEQMKMALNEVGELQRAVSEGRADLGMLQTLGQAITSRLQGVAEFVLAGGGSSTLHSAVVVPIAEWAIGALAPMWIVDQGTTPISAAAKRAYEEIMAFHDKYAFLEDTGGRPK